MADEKEIDLEKVMRCLAFAIDRENHTILRGLAQNAIPLLVAELKEARRYIDELEDVAEYSHLTGDEM